MRSNTFLRLAQSVFFFHYTEQSFTPVEKTSKILAFYIFCGIHSREGPTDCKPDDCERSSKIFQLLLSS